MVVSDSVVVLDWGDPDDDLVRGSTAAVTDWLSTVAPIAGLIGVAFLIFDRLFNLSAYLTGRAVNETNVHHRIDQLQRDLTELKAAVDRIIDTASDRNNRLQTLSGTLEVKVAEFSRDMQAVMRDLEHLRQEQRRRDSR